MIKCTYLFDFILSTWLWAVTFGTSWLFFVPCISFIVLYFWFKERFLESVCVPIVIEAIAITIHTFSLFLLSNFYTPEELLFNQQQHRVSYLCYSTIQMVLLYFPLQLGVLYGMHILPFEWVRWHISFKRQAYALIISCGISTLLSYQVIRVGLIGG